MKPCKCPDGHEARIQKNFPFDADPNAKGWFVLCKESTYCWAGPVRKTVAAATKAWNDALRVPAKIRRGK